MGLSDCGGIGALEIPSYEAAMQVTPWWTWAWGRVTGSHSGAWTPYKPAGSQESLVGSTGRFASIGMGDPLAWQAPRWEYQQVQGGVQGQSSQNGVRMSWTLTATGDADLYQLVARWEAPAGAKGPFWVGLEDQLLPVTGVYDPHPRLAAVVDGELQQVTTPADLIAKPKLYEGELGWLGLEDRYFIAAMLPSEPGWNNVQAKTRLQGDSSRSFAWSEAPKAELAPGESYQTTFRFYAGPKDVERLASLGGGLELGAALGFFGFFAKILLFFLHIFQGFVENWGVAIVLLTFFVRASLYPLAARAFRNAKAMQVVQPEIKALQEKYAEDKETLNREMMKLFTERQVNPVGGCLPLFIQMPVFFALYSALQVTPDLYHQSFLYLQDLSAPDPYGFFPLLMSIGMVVQQQMTPMTGMDPVQQRMMKLMPLMFALFMFTVPSGLAVYYAINTALSILQQWYNTRSYELASAAAAQRG
jgi:YidC/Oxa1 family membrane protein insertase